LYFSKYAIWSCILFVLIHIYLQFQFADFVKYSQIVFPFLNDFALVHVWNCEQLQLFCFRNLDCCYLNSSPSSLQTVISFHSGIFSSSTYMHRKQWQITSFLFLRYISYESTDISTLSILVLLYHTKKFAIIPISKLFSSGGKYYFKDRDYPPQNLFQF